MAEEEKKQQNPVIASILDNAVNIAGSGSSLINAPFRFVKTGKNFVQGIKRGFDAYNKRQENIQKQKQRAQEKELKKLALQKKLEDKQKAALEKERLNKLNAENRRLDMIDKAVDKMSKGTVNQFEIPQKFDVNQVMEPAKQQQLAQDMAKYNKQMQRGVPKVNKQLNSPKTSPIANEKTFQQQLGMVNRANKLDVDKKLKMAQAQKRKEIGRQLANPVVDPTGASKRQQTAKKLSGDIQKPNKPNMPTPVASKPKPKQPKPKAKLETPKPRNDFEAKLKGVMGLGPGD